MKGRALAMQFSRGVGEWETPLALFEEMDREFHFEMDVCATAENAKCARFWSPAEDGLAQPWEGRCWCNPPYGRGIGDWLKKARASAAAGALVVCLVPSRTDTAWWHEQVMPADEIRLLRGRLVFHGATNKAPFASAIIIYRPAGLFPSREGIVQARK